MQNKYESRFLDQCPNTHGWSFTSSCAQGKVDLLGPSSSLARCKPGGAPSPLLRLWSFPSPTFQINTAISKCLHLSWVQSQDTNTFLTVVRSNASNVTCRLPFAIGLHGPRPPLLLVLSRVPDPSSLKFIGLSSIVTQHSCLHLLFL